MHATSFSCAVLASGVRAVAARARGVVGVSHAGRIATSTPAAATTGRLGRLVGAGMSTSAASLLATASTVAAATAPLSVVNHSGERHGSGR